MKNIKVKITTPPLGLSENQEFESLSHIVAFLEANKERLPFANYKHGVITYGREVYETKEPVENSIIQNILNHVSEVEHDEPAQTTQSRSEKENKPACKKTFFEKIKSIFS